MVYIHPEFTPATLSEDDKYEGTELDANVFAALPPGTKIDWVATYGASFWAISTKVDAVLPDGMKQSYFLKVYTAGSATDNRDMAVGEFEGSKLLYSVIPQNTPKPIGAGTLAKDPSKGFVLAEFRDMSDEMPSTSDFVSTLAKLHSVKSPNGKFGFHMRTFHGNLPLDNEWCDTWEEYFTKQMKISLQREKEVHEVDEEIEELGEQLIAKVIPRLLRPMETNGRRLEPSLIHGDMWHGNVGFDNETDEPVLYDPSLFYGHNEFEFHCFRADRYRTNRTHVRAYHKLIDMTPPASDHDDRNMLYALRTDLQISIMYSANKRTRQLAKEKMKILVAKYPNGYEGYQDADVAPGAALHEKLEATSGADSSKNSV